MGFTPTPLYFRDLWSCPTLTEDTVCPIEQKARTKVTTQKFMLFVSSENQTFPTVLGRKTLRKYKYISVALQQEALWGKVCPLARWQQEEKERFPRMTGRASPGAPAAPSSGTSANAQICEFLRIITTMRENKQTMD